jgi:Domain of Unknown Function with PDB structure (DUF3857)
MHPPTCLQKMLVTTVFLLAARVNAQDVWSAPALSADAGALRQAAQTIETGKHSEATLFLNDLHFRFDETGKLTETRHLIYRIENQQGVEDWSETSGRWEAWHQAKPEIKARVVTAEGTTHWLDPKTLNDVPVHEDAPDTYSDERKYGGPLPALAPGAIVEEEVVIRDTAPLFAAGTVHRWSFGWSVPANKTRVALTHPTSLPLKYQIHLLADAAVSRTSENGLETIIKRRAYSEATACQEVPVENSTSGYKTRSEGIGFSTSGGAEFGSVVWFCIGRRAIR